MRRNIVLILGLTAGVALLGACEKLKPVGSRGSRAASTSSSVSSGDKVKVEMYVMSKCPFGVQAEQGFQPVMDAMGDAIDWQVNFIVDEQNGSFNSLHGEPEVKGDIQQLCVMKHYPAWKKWTGFISCYNENWRQIPEGWEKCAKKMGMDEGKLKSCIDGSQGKDLLRGSMKKAKAANAQGSPTILVAGEAYNGGRGKTDFTRAICDKFPGKKPAACDNIPEDVEVVATILTDKRCAKCATEGLVQNLKGRFFPKLKAKTIDYSSSEGKALYKELGAKYLPVMLFTKDVEKAEKYQMIARWMEEKGKYKQLRIPAQFDPTAEICDNKKDDTGNGKVDSADDTCKNALVCRQEKPKTVEVFIMSQCPFGVQAVNAMKEVMKAFDNKITFDVHYIADKQGDSFNSLHGQAEVNEDIRQVCVKKHYAKNYKWLDYLWCRYTGDDWKSDNWKKCATGGIEASVIEKCFNGEGKSLLEEDIKIAKALEVSGSPTWLANNKYKFSGIAPEAIKTNICQHNEGLKGCDKKLTEKTNAPAAGSCGN